MNQSEVIRILRACRPPGMDHMIEWATWMAIVRKFADHWYQNNSSDFFYFVAQCRGDSDNGTGAT